MSPLIDSQTQQRTRIFAVGVAFLSGLSVLAGAVTAYALISRSPSTPEVIKTSPAHGGAPMSLEQVNAVLKTATQGQAVAYAVFPGPDGLTGALVGDANPVSPSAQQRVISWVNPSGYVMTGSLVAPNGANLTLGAIQAFGSRGVAVAQAGEGSATNVTPGAYQARAVSAQQTAASSDGSVQVSALPSGISEIKQSASKSGAPELTVFFDPNCVFCHVMWGNINSEALAGKIRVQWVPVGILRPDSMPRAATLIGGGMPAMKRNEAGFNGGTETGGAPLSNNQADIDTAKQNTQKFLTWAADNHLSPATPTLVWKASDGKMRAVVGAQTVEWVNDALGLR